MTIRTSTELDAARQECLNLLIVYFTYRGTVAEFDRSWSRFELHRWWTTLRVFENDLIMRICRLDDDDKSLHSLRQALQSVRPQLLQKEASALDARLKTYRQLINPLKTKARNYFLAHLDKKATKVPVDPRGGLEVPLAEVVNIVDAMVGETVHYRLRVGSLEPELDLRSELSGNTTRA